MEILIYGAGYMGKIALELMKKDYKADWKITGFIDRYRNGQYCGVPIFGVKDIEDFKGRIIIALFDYDMARSVCKLLHKCGFKDIFWFQQKKQVLNCEDFIVEQCCNCNDWGDNILQQIEMHVIDACNLNCKGCAHFSPIFSDALPDLDSRLLDVEIIKQKVDHIMRFYILGGEPFLNPEIGSYISGIRKILPNTELYIVTNGLLIEHLSEEVLKSIKENKVWISISEYPPTKKRIDNILNILYEFKILYELRGNLQNETFNLPLSLSKHSKYKKTCISQGCVTIWNGKIARCPQVMYIGYFNSYFNTDLPEKGVLELKDDIKGAELLSFLNERVPLCEHCVQNEIEWSICGKSAKLDDFTVYD